MNIQMDVTGSTAQRSANNSLASLTWCTGPLSEGDIHKKFLWNCYRLSPAKSGLALSELILCMRLYTSSLNLICILTTQTPSWLKAPYLLTVWLLLFMFQSVRSNYLWSNISWPRKCICSRLWEVEIGCRSYLCIISIDAKHWQLFNKWIISGM